MGFTCLDRTWFPNSSRQIYCMTTLQCVLYVRAYDHSLKWFDRLRSGGPITANVDGAPVPVVGLGHILAVALLLNDVDCVGGKGGNVGFTVLVNSVNDPIAVQAIKIDPGMAFHLCTRREGVNLGEFNRGRKQSLQALSDRLLPLSPSVCFPYTRLPRATREEFLDTVRDILELNCMAIQRWFTRGGLELLFNTPDSIANAVKFVESRREALRGVYGGELLPRMQCIDDCLSLLKSGYSGAIQVTDPVTGEVLTVGDRAVLPSLLSVPRREGEGGDAGEQGGKKVPITLKELSQTSSGLTQRINLVGGAGYGKSTFCQVGVRTVLG